MCAVFVVGIECCEMLFNYCGFDWMFWWNEIYFVFVVDGFGWVV